VAIAFGVSAEANPGGYVYLELLAHPVAAVVAAVVMLGAAGSLALRNTAAMVAQIVAVTLAMVVGTLGLFVWSLDSDPEATGVVASSEGFEVMSYRRPGLFSSDDVLLRLRSRAGLATDLERPGLSTVARRVGVIFAEDGRRPVG
jgi:hypothetical protein